MIDSESDGSFYEDEEDEMDIIHEISQYEYEINDYLEDRANGKYYIGSYIYSMDSFLEETGYSIRVMETEPQIFFGENISACTFFRFGFSDIVRFLEYCVHPEYFHSTASNQNPNCCRFSFENTLKVHILQLHIRPIKIREDFLAEQYLCVLKTYWISLIQRHWKRIFQERKKFWKYYRNPAHLKKRELGYKRISVSGLRGMLSCYSSKK